MRTYVLVFFISVFSLQVFGQEKYTISGYIKDQETGEALIGATLFAKELSTGTSANVYGFYSATLPKGKYTLVYSYIGYNSVTKEIELNSNQKIDMELATNSQVLQEVVITGEREDKNVESVEMSTVNLKIETIKKMPALLGEVDVLRTIQLLPGVQSGGEGSTGFFVRGGGLDQNMILLDEAPVYNAAHLLGFFSVFNADAVKDAQLYKGGIPAQYGGRLSSVLDVRMRDGNNKKLNASGGIGLISSRLTIEGPIIKDKASFIISGRRMYIDVFRGLSKREALKNTRFYFYDLNGKVNFKLNDKNRIFISGYSGRDILSLSDLFKFGWGNNTVTGRWNHLFNDKLFLNTTLVYSNFDYLIGIPSGTNAFDYRSNIIDYSIKNDFTFYPNTNNTINFGLHNTYHIFRPADFEPGEDNEQFKAIKLPYRYVLENAIYIANEQRFGARLSAQYGLRYSAFSNMGVDTVYNYDENHDTIPGESYTAYGKGDIYNTYHGPEPRLAVKYSVTDVSSVKLSYNRTRQYLHLASNSTGGAPIDVWFPSSPNVKPQLCDQVAIGYFQNFKQNMFESSVEVYYKKMQNQIDFKNNAQLLFNLLLEGEIRTGDAESYGAEFFLKKSKGKLTGWISYTLSKATRTIPEINNGNTYRANYDRRHNFTIVLSYQVMERLDVNVNWVYNTGAPVTVPVGKYEYQGQYVPIYSERNGGKMPDFHRLDASVNYQFKPKKRFENSLSVSVYNAYNRKNPYSINFKQREDNPNETFAEMTYLFGIVPAITWNFNF